MSEQFDNLIKERLSEYTPEVPAHIWDQIAERRNKRRLAFWIWISENRKRLLLFAALIAVTLTLHELSGLLPASSPANNWAQNEEPSVKESEKLKIAHLKTSENKDAVSQIDEYSYNESRHVSSVKKNSTNQKVRLFANKKSKKENETGISSQKKMIENGDMKLSVSEGGIENQNKPVRKRSKHKSPAKEDLMIVITSNEADLPDQKTNSINGIDIENLPATEMPPFTFILRREPADLKPVSTGVITRVVPCPEELSAANKKYLEFYFSPDHTIKTYKDTGNSEYLRRRKESVSNLFSYSVGARYTKVFNNAMSIRAGINYSRIIEKMNTIEGNIIKVIYILNSDNDTIGNYSTRVTIYKTSYNRYNTIDIPLVLGYEFGNGKMHGNLNAGVIANIYSWQKGSTLNDSFGSVSINTRGPASPYQFKTNMGLGFSGSLSLYYRLQDRMQFMAEPYFRYSLSAANKEEITLRQKFHTVGLRLGIRYDLNKIIE